MNAKKKLTRLGSLVGIILLACSNSLALDGTWTNTVDGTWTNVNNWAGGIVADGAGGTAAFVANLSADKTITLGTTTRTIGNLSFTNLNAAARRTRHGEEQMIAPHRYALHERQNDENKKEDHMIRSHNPTASTQPKEHLMKRPFFIAAALLAGVATTHAGILAQNSFDLGLADGTALAGVAVNATGFSGNYSVVNTTQGGSQAYETFTTNGLSFGANFHEVSGGAALVRTHIGYDTSQPARAQLIATISATATGTVYSRYLISFDAVNGLQAGNWSFDRVTAGNLNTSVNMQMVGAQWTQAAGVGVGGVYATVPFLPTASTTYLVLSRFTNVSTASAVCVATLWIFDVTHYDAWYAAGGDEEELATYANKTVSYTSPAGTYNLNGTFNNTVNSGNTWYWINQTLDEFAAGTALANVVKMPPKGTVIIIR